MRFSSLFCAVFYFIFHVIKLETVIQSLEKEKDQYCLRNCKNTTEKIDDLLESLAASVPGSPLTNGDRDLASEIRFYSLPTSNITSKVKGEAKLFGLIWSFKGSLGIFQNPEILILLDRYKLIAVAKKI